MTEPEPFPEQVVGVLELITIDSITALASRLVAAPAASPVRVNPPGGEAPTVAALVAAAAEWGLESELSPVEVDRSNVSVSLPGGDGPGLLLLGHTDVVPLGDGWSVDPWAGLVREGRLYGRGAADMKGGLAACVIAMAAIRSAGIRLSGPIELAAVVDEEETGKGIRHYLSTVDRQGYVGCVVAEPTDLQTIIAARGDSYFRFTVTGRAAHSGQPSDGVNAIYGAARIVSDLEAWHGELGRNAHPLVGPATWSVGTIEGGSGTSTVPAECVVMADRRLLPGEDRDQVLAAVQDRIDRLGLADRGLTVRVEMIMDMPGFETPADHDFVTTSDRAITDAGGPSLDLGGWTAACDGGFLARDAGLPVVVLGPGSVATQAHQPDESVALADLLIAARAYALIALRTLLPSTSTVYQNEETLR